VITRKTVLVLGAGASVPFGFPSGPGLVKSICESLRSGNARSVIEDILAERQFRGSRYFDKFLDSLQKSGQLSIDSFLEHNPEWIALGKLAISACLIPFEEEQKLFRFGDDCWYRQLFKAMNSTFEEFTQNKITILTFNYDRSLEHFLATALRYTHQVEYQLCLQSVLSLPIIHLHGHLGSLNNVDDEEGRVYKTDCNPYFINVAARNIQIIHEGGENGAKFESAKKALSNAEVIAFLGFGYDEINLERLGIRKLAFEASHYDEQKMIYGSAYQLGQARREWVYSYFYSSIALADSRTDEMLADFPILIHPVPANYKEDFEIDPMKLQTARRSRRIRVSEGTGA